MRGAGVTARLGYALTVVLLTGMAATPNGPRDPVMTDAPRGAAAGAASMELLERLEMLDLLELLETPEIWSVHEQPKPL